MADAFVSSRASVIQEQKSRPDYDRNGSMADYRIELTALGPSTFARPYEDVPRTHPFEALPRIHLPYGAGQLLLLPVVAC